VRKLFDLQDPFFAPPGIRVAIVAITALWGLFELWTGATLWGIIFLGVSAICGWRFATIDYSESGDE